MEAVFDLETLINTATSVNNRSSMIRQQSASTVSLHFQIDTDNLEGSLIGHRMAMSDLLANFEEKEDAPKLAPKNMNTSEEYPRFYKNSYICWKDYGIE